MMMMNFLFLLMYNSCLVRCVCMQLSKFRRLRSFGDTEMRLQPSDAVDTDDDDGLIRRNCRPVQPRGTRRVRTAPGRNGPGLLPAAGHHPNTVSLLPRIGSSGSIGGGGDSGGEEPFRDH